MILVPREPDLKRAKHRGGYLQRLLLIAVLIVMSGACGKTAASTIELGGSDDGMISGYSIFDSSQSTALYLQNVERFHEDLGVCLAAQGFDYVRPVSDPSSIWPQQYLDDLATGINEQAFASEYGFGVFPILVMPTDSGALPDPGSPGYDEEAIAQAQAELSERIEAYPDEDTPEGAAYWVAMDGTSEETTGSNFAPLGPQRVVNDSEGVSGKIAMPGSSVTAPHLG